MSSRIGRPGTESVSSEVSGAGGTELLGAQEAYLLAFLAAAADVSGGGALSEAAVQELTTRMQVFLPDAPLPFMIALSAQAVLDELYGNVNGEPTPEQG